MVSLSYATGLCCVGEAPWLSMSYGMFFQGHVCHREELGDIHTGVGVACDSLVLFQTGPAFFTTGELSDPSRIRGTGDF